jgi:tRNA(Ile)-lysidine synthase
MNKNVPAAKPTKTLTPSAFLKRLRALQNVPHYGLAVSGGADSMAMMYLASRAEKLRGAPRFTVFTVDHGLRPEARDEVKMVAQQCRRLGLHCHILRWHEGRGGAALQARARQARYELMSAACRKRKIPALVTAHHAVDQMETLLMRLARGSDLTGLRGMQGRRQLGDITILRPLLDQVPATLQALCERHEVPFVSDPSNDDRTFERVRWRQTALQIFETGLSAERLALSTARLAAVDDDIDRMVDEFIISQEVITPLGVACIPRSAFAALPQTLKRRLLQRLLAWIGGSDYPISAAMVDSLSQALAAGEPKGRTLAGCMIRPRRSVILIGREYAAIAALTTPATGRHVSWDGRFTVSCRRAFAAGAEVRSLGRTGLDEIKARGATLDSSIPHGLLQTLPAVFIGKNLHACPLIMACSDYRVVIDMPFASK